jgi:hypothetical protein
MITINKRKIGIFLIVAVVIIIIIVVVFSLLPEGSGLKNLFNNKTTEETKTPEELFNEMQAQKESEKNYTFDAEAEQNREWTQNDFKQIARSFAERFGSYSNQSDYGNIEDLDSLMSSDMKIWANGYVANLKANSNSTDNYYGIITKALIEPEITNFDLNSNRVETVVSTQREETLIDGQTKNFKQDIKIVFIQEDGKWLVDSATWQ